MSPVIQPDGCPAIFAKWPTEGWPAVQAPLNSVLFALALVYAAVGLSAFFLWRRKYAFLSKRGIFGQVLCCVALLMQLVIVLLREAIGRTNFPCDLYMVLALLCVPVFAGPTLVRLVRFMAQYQRAKQQAAYNDEVIINTDPKLFNSSRRAMRINLSARMGESVTNSLGHSSRRALAATTQAINPVPVLKAAMSTLSKVVKTTGEQVKHEINLVDLRHAQELTSSRASFLVFVVVVLPFAISIGVIFTKSGYYGHGCIGCTLYKSEEYLFIGQFVAIAVLSTLMFIPLRKAEDPLLILWEIKWSGTFAGLGAILGFVIDLFDPGRLASSGYLTWGWFIVLGMMMALGMCTYWPLYHAHKLAAQAEATRLEGITLDDVLKDPVLKSAFAVHLVHEFAIESLRFWETVNVWKITYDMNPLRRDEQALVLYETFIAPGSSMEVNISASQRAKIEACLDEEAVRRNCFDEALEEIHTMMARDTFLRFVRSEAFRELRSSNRASVVGFGSGVLTSVPSGTLA